MDAAALFRPTLYAYVAYVAEFCMRYFVFVGGLYWVFYVGFTKWSDAYRIQRTFPDRAAVRHEIWWSMTNTATTAASSVFTYYLVHRGATSMYFGLADYGWLYLPVSAALCVLGYDTWLYWQHRFLHTRVMFQHVHWVHHRVGNPTPFATFAMHPIETAMGNVYFVLFTVFVPAHPLAIAAAGGYMFVYGTMCHLGYELLPRWFARHPLLRYFNNSTYHNLHHSVIRCNYGAWFIFWDRLMGTAYRGYEDTWDAVIARRSAASAAPHPAGRAA
jgi:sterol desaturase/sphingolipid hydroxylase (fatty acid hydroxylase superfamily)